MIFSSRKGKTDPQGDSVMVRSVTATIVPDCMNYGDGSALSLVSAVLEAAHGLKNRASTPVGPGGWDATPVCLDNKTQRLKKGIILFKT